MDYWPWIWAHVLSTRWWFLLIFTQRWHCFWDRGFINLCFLRWSCKTQRRFVFWKVFCRLLKNWLFVEGYFVLREHWLIPVKNAFVRCEIVLGIQSFVSGTYRHSTWNVILCNSLGKLLLLNQNFFSLQVIGSLLHGAKAYPTARLANIKFLFVFKWRLETRSLLHLLWLALLSLMLAFVVLNGFVFELDI